MTTDLLLLLCVTKSQCVKKVSHILVDKKPRLETYSYSCRKRRWYRTS